MMSFRSSLLILLTLMLALPACRKKRENNCRDTFRDWYNNEDRVEIVSHDKVAFRFLPTDHRLFSYHGYDTLVYALFDDSGYRDTITFIGTGLQIETIHMGYVIREECTAQVYYDSKKVSFRPLEPGYDTLYFQMAATHSGFSYRYTWGKQFWESFSAFHYYSAYALDGHEFYDVRMYWSYTNPGTIYYYLSPAKQAFLIYLNNGQALLRIN